MGSFNRRSHRIQFASRCKPRSSLTMMWCGREWWSNEARRTLLMVNLAGIMERADEALLPGVYREIGLALHASPAQLGSLTLVRSLMQAFFAPLAAYAAVNHNRAHVIALGAVLWAVATFFVGISATFTQVSFISTASSEDYSLPRRCCNSEIVVSRNRYDEP